MKKLVITFLFFGYIVFFSENVVAVNKVIKVTPSQFDENFSLLGGAEKTSQTANYVDVRLTKAIPNSPNGRFRFNDYLSFDSDFSLQTGMKVIKNYNSVPADGFSFIFYQGLPDLNKGMPGQGLGMLGIPDAMGLIVDLYYNPKDDNNVKYWQDPADAEDPKYLPYFQIWSTDDNGLGKREMYQTYGNFESNFYFGSVKDVNITYTASTRRINYQVQSSTGMTTFWYTVPESYRYGSLLVSGSVGGSAAEQTVRFKGFTYESYRERTVEFVDNVTGEVVKTTKVSGQPYDTYSIDPMYMAKSKDDGGKDITPYYTIDDPSIINGQFGTIKDDMEFDENGQPLDRWKTTKINVTARPVWGDVPWEFTPETGVLTFLTNGKLNEYTQSPWNRTDKYKLNPKDIKQIVFKDSVVSPKDSSYLFSSITNNELSNLTSIEGIDLIDVSQTTDTSYMFKGASNLVSLPINNWNTSNVTNMTGMFSSVSGLEMLDLSKWDTLKVVNMNSMFSDATSLKSLNISGFVTLKTDVTDMFSNTSNLSSLTLGQYFRDNTFKSNLPNIPHNGQWKHQSTNKLVGQSNIFLKNYDGTLNGTYIWSEPIKVKATIKYLNKETKLPIYEDIITKKTKEDDSVEFDISKPLKDNIDELISENILNLNYEGYQSITSNDYVVRNNDGSEIKPSETPTDDLTLIFYYTGSIYIKEAPNISFGEVTRNLIGNTSVSPVKNLSSSELVLINTSNQNEWKLTANLPNGIYNQSNDMVKLQSNLILKRPDNSGNIVLNNQPNVIANNDQLSVDPVGKINLESSLQLNVFSKNDTGNYTGTIVWSIDRTP